MRGCGIFGDDEYDSDDVFDSPPKRKLVLVGRTGNGKSATGNSILGQIAFKSARLSCGVTQTCELQEARVMDRRVTVIDTPGFVLDSNSDFEIGEESSECIDWLKDGIHAVIVVLSTCSHFSDEEDAKIRSLTRLFGSEVSKYMILVFTGGDDIPSLPNYIGTGCPNTLKNFISHCGGRVVLFDNKTVDENKKGRQVRQLLFLVDCVLCQNGGQLLRIDRFRESKRMKEETLSLEKRLAEEQSARLEGSRNLKDIRMKHCDEIWKLNNEIAMLKEKLREEHEKRLEAEKNLQEIEMKPKRFVSKDPKFKKRDREPTVVVDLLDNL